MTTKNECGHTHTSTRKHALAGFAVPALATGLVALALPLGGSPAAAAAGDDFGYSALVVASPVFVEFYEPTIPIPATPQFSLEFGYTKVLADSSSSRGRATFVWPSDAVGEGAKTIEESVFAPFGFPPEITGPIYDAGYPIQVNSGYPSGPAGDANEPFPGTVMRTGATELVTYAQTGYSTTCDTSGGAEGEGSGDGDGEGDGGTGIPGLPELPVTLSDLFGSSAERSAPTTRTSARTTADEPGECQLPGQLAALASFGGFSSSSQTERTADKIIGTSRSAVGDIAIAGGVVTLSGVNAKVTSSSDGTTPEGRGKANYGTITIAGQTFGIGPDGVEGGGSTSPIPGLPDEPNAALKQLGLTVTVPEPVFERDGKQVKSVVEGVVVEIDTKALSDAFRQIPVEDVILQLPEELKDVKKALQAAVNLSPKIVMHLGRATSKVETVDPIVLPTPTPTPTEDPSPTGGAGGGGTGSGGLGGTTTTPGGTTPLAPTGDTPVGDLEDTVLASSKLPPLFSIPTFMFLVGLGGAAVAGSYARRLGAAALGAGGACSHGLDSGLPDLRKANG